MWSGWIPGHFCNLLSVVVCLHDGETRELNIKKQMYQQTLNQAVELHIQGGGDDEAAEGSGRKLFYSMSVSLLTLPMPTSNGRIEKTRIKVCSDFGAGKLI